jgi:hypothetical protein
VTVTLGNDDKAIRKMSTPSATRRSALLAKFEHAITEDNDTGLPITWLVPRGSKAQGHSDHWVAVAAGEPLVCSCGELIYPAPEYEVHALEHITAHFEAAS